MKIAIADRSLRDERGHHLALTRVLSEGAFSNAEALYWITHRDFPRRLAIEGAVIVAQFSRTMYDSPDEIPELTSQQETHMFGNITRFITRVRRSAAARLPLPARARARLDVPVKPATPDPTLAQELHAALRNNDLGGDDHVLVHSCDGEMYRTVLQLLLSENHQQLPFIHLVTSFDDHTMPHYRRDINVARVVDYYRILGALDKRVFLYAENPPLAEVLSNIWQTHVESLEIPLSRHKPMPEKIDTPKLTVSYLGAAREEKGFLMLPKVVAECLALNSNIRFQIQCSPQIVGYTSAIKATIEELETFSKHTVKLVREVRSPEGYQSMLQETDVVLACYDEEKYQVRGSGIAVDAISNACSLITTPGTSPDRIGQTAAHSATGPTEIARVLDAISKDRLRYSEIASSRRNAYARENNPNAYWKKLVSRTVGAKEVTSIAAKRTSRDRNQKDWRGAQASPQISLLQFFEPDGGMEPEDIPSVRMLGRTPSNLTRGTAIKPASP